MGLLLLETSQSPACSSSVVGQFVQPLSACQGPTPRIRAHKRPVSNAAIDVLCMKTIGAVLALWTWKQQPSM